MIKSQTRATKLYSNKYAEHQVQIMEEQLKAVQNDVQLTKPISVRLKQLKKAEGDCLKAVEGAQTKVKQSKEAAAAAISKYDQAKEELEQAKVDCATAQDEVAEAALQKADWGATRLGQQASSIVEALNLLEEQCDNDALSALLRGVIALAWRPRTVLVLAKPVNVPISR